MGDDKALDLKDYIRDVPDFPKPGILFRDITPLLSAPVAFSQCIDEFVARYDGQGIDIIAAAEARGFIFAVPLAMRLGAAFVPVRKPGKLPFRTHSLQYELEYGTDRLEIHEDSIEAGQRVLIIDDLLATGGTVEACCRLVEQCDAIVAGCGFLINLTFLNGAERLGDRELFSILEY
ncbi:MAG: adenine phosphoribosyltransferase [Pirellulaceae bacterium]